jgi:NADH:ubiquinone oxidoreductase subunit 3 (subunit A)
MVVRLALAGLAYLITLGLAYVWRKGALEWH